MKCTPNPIAFGLTLLATPALAHPGDHGAVRLLHLLTEPDHLAMIALAAAVVVLVAVKLRGRS
jgi:hypothetical protein